MNKKILYFISFAFIISIILIPNWSHASDEVLYSITMDINIDKNGTAQIKEVWDINIDNGTELYKQYNNLETSEIVDFSVTEKGNKYKTLSTWDSSLSQADKKNKCGINKINNGAELCWGIGEYGRREYTLEYSITNFVYELNGSQVSNFILIPDLENLAPKYVKIKINTFYKLNEDNIKVSLSGFSGNYALNSNGDGSIEVYSSGALKSGDYVNTNFTFQDKKFSLSNEKAIIKKDVETKSNKTAKKVFVTLCGVFGLFIIANVVEEKNRKKKELAKESEETE